MEGKQSSTDRWTDSTEALSHARQVLYRWAIVTGFPLFGAGSHAAKAGLKTHYTQRITLDSRFPPLLCILGRHQCPVYAVLGFKPTLGKHPDN